MKYQRFEDLPVWQQSFELTKRIHAATSSGSFSKDYALRDQIRRAAISISSNIAEGFERHNRREYIRFLYYAKASAAETRSQIHLATAYNYIDRPTANDFVHRLMQIGSSINGFINYLKNLK